MAKNNKPTFEDVKALTFHIVKSLLRNQRYFKLDVWDVINQMYVMGVFDDLRNDKALGKQLQYRAIDALREMHGRKITYRYKARAAQVYFSDFEIERQQQLKHHGRVSIEKVFASKVSNDDFSFEDELAGFFNSFYLRRDEKLATTLTCHGYTNDEIGKVIGVSESRVSQLLSRVRQLGQIYAKDKLEAA